VHDRNKLFFLGLAVLVLSGSARGSVRPKGGAVSLNPRTGKPIVTPGTKKLSSAEIRALAVGSGVANADKALAIAIRESGGYADVVVDTRGMSLAELQAYWPDHTKKYGPELSVGLWQINVLANGALLGLDAEALKDPAADPSEAIAKLADPAANAATLAALVKAHGWAPWGG